MSRPRLLDLFCGAGGAAMGYHRAGFDVVGVDIVDQPRYPFEFHQADALTWPLDGFDAIHASPPCQAYSVLRRANPHAEYPDLVAFTRQRLEESDVPWVMENVPGAPVRAVIVLCGSMFDLGAGVRQLRRHRLFELSHAMLQPQCQHRGEAVGVYGGGPIGRYTFENGVRKGLKGRRGGYQGTMAERRQAMGVDWMTSTELNNAIPPAYTEWIGTQLIERLTCAA
ncbi:MAG TPA: DNA cytosine methyltransferase [Acidimicrobiales bacterium]|nr:DNA cytosine methyltransferase [Acidimicrobiales bacterium]